MSEEIEEGEPIAIPMKKGLGGMGIVVVVLTAICSTAGAAFGPMITSRVAAKPAASAGEAQPVEEPPAESITLEPLIVDVREGTGPLHHLKVTLALELGAKPKDEEEIKRLIPRARDAAIEFTRALTFDEVTNPKRFESLRADLGERVAKAIGQSRVKKVLFTDFVVQ